MKILIYTNLFHPDEIAGASLYTDMARFFRDQGHDVRVVGTFGYYPDWCLRPEDRGQWVREDVFESIPVKRVKMWVPAKPTGLTRMLSDFSFFLSIWISGRFRGWSPDVILTAEPMLSQCLVQRFLYPFKKIPRLIIVQDFVVDAALELGILKLPLISHGLRWMERWALRSARTLTSISEPMVEKLRGIVGAGRRLLYIPNWIHVSLEEEIQRQGDGAPRASGVLFYSGNVGMKQGLPQFLADFETAGSAGWSIRIHGGGANIDTLREAAAEKEFIALGDLLDEPEYVRALQEVSACLITQQPGVSANFLPSKLLPALAAGTPVLAVCDADSPLGREVAEGQCGAIVAPGDVDALKSVLETWSSNPDQLAALGRNARRHAEKFSRGNILSRFESELSALAQ